MASLPTAGLTVQRIAQLRDRDGIYASGLNVPTQVEIRGYRDSAGKLQPEFDVKVWQ